jgi:hypothetical protein
VNVIDENEAVTIPWPNSMVLKTLCSSEGWLKLSQPVNVLLKVNGRTTVNGPGVNGALIVGALKVIGLTVKVTSGYDVPFTVAGPLPILPMYSEPRLIASPGLQGEQASGKTLPNSTPLDTSKSAPIR